jgi:hypothetical protein
MDAFEQVISDILRIQGYWVQSSFKVELTKPEKRSIGRPANPRWELDIVAYKGRENVLRVVECKSYLDNPGVRLSAFDGTSDLHAARFKLFNGPKLRRVVFGRLCRQLVKAGACRKNPQLRLTLACGKIRNRDREAIRAHFLKKGWDLWDESWLRERLADMAKQGYANQISTVVAKLLLRAAPKATNRARFGASHGASRNTAKLPSR